MSGLTVAPLCPQCGEIMQEVPNGRTGPFWGCPKYRETGCRGSAPMKLPADRKPTGVEPTGVEPTSILVFDTETTGLGALAEIVEIACWALDAGTLRQLGAPVSYLARPARPIPADATAIHGISDAMVAQAAPPRDAVVKVLEYARKYGGANPAWAAHNASYDVWMVKRALGMGSSLQPDWPVYCTLEVARKAFPKLANHKLDHLGQRLGCHAGDAHRALGDVATTAGVLRKTRKVWDDFAWGPMNLAGRI